MHYEPREDSELLRTHVERLARGDVLDMGTGSGVQAIAAAKREEVTTVLAVDISEEALDAASQLLENEDEAVREKVRLVQSDLFTDIKESFDTIVCNPPYLPDEEKDEHPALYGGPHGWEFTVAFLKQAKEHLKPGGNVLLVVSTLANKEHVLNVARHEGYHLEQLAEEAFFFERLSVQRLWR